MAHSSRLSICLAIVMRTPQISIVRDRQPTQLRDVEISSKRYRHGKPPSFAMLNQNRADLGISKESRFQGLGISYAERTLAGAFVPLALVLAPRAFALIRRGARLHHNHC